MPLPNDGKFTGYNDRNGVPIHFGEIVSEYKEPDVLKAHRSNRENRGTVVCLFDNPPHNVWFTLAVGEEGNRSIKRKPQDLYHL